MKVGRTDGVAAVLDMALNEGTRCSPRCLEVLAAQRWPDALRRYGPADDGPLRRAIATAHGLDPDHVLVGNGSGVLIRTCVPAIIEARIRASPVRVLRHLIARRGDPILTTWPTYSKIPASALRLGMACDPIPLLADHTLDLARLRRRLARGGGFVYLCNPNNPTGRLVATRAQLEALVVDFPRSFFAIDEAYVEFLPPARQPDVAALVARHDNLLVLRSFSFAHGLAGAHVGYALCNAPLAARLRERFTPHQVSALASALAIAALADQEHLERVRREVAIERARLTAALEARPGVRVYPSETNFLLARASGPARPLHDALRARGIKIKLFDPVGALRMDEHFRVTVGLAEENTALIAALAELP